MYRQIKDVRCLGSAGGEPNPITCMLKSKSLDHSYTIRANNM